jgi:hypothetical protein
MTNLLLAAVVIGAVIAFGALISIGNERQRRAIDALHRAYKQWALQDLRLKRGTVSTQIQITDLAAWLTKVTSLALDHKTNVIEYQIHDVPFPVVEFQDRSSTVLLALESPAHLIPILRAKNSALRGQLLSNPLFRVSKKTPALEMTILNAGAIFDIELPIAWKALTTQSTESSTLWLYIIN